MRLTIRCDRSHPGRFRLEEVHALCAGDLYNPLVVEGAEGADPLTLHLLLLPSAGSPESSALARAEGFGRERGHAGCMRSVLSLRTAELRDLWDSATESSESSDGAPSALDVVRSAHLLVRDSAGLTLASGPVPLVLRPLSDWDYAAADPPRDGFTPTVSVEEVSGGVRVTAANRYGSESAVVRDGVDGGTPSIAVSKDRRTGVVAVSAYGPDGALESRETIGPFPDLGPVERRLGALEGADAGKSARGIAAEEVAAVVGAAPEALDTLKEIADFLSDDQTAGTVARRLLELESGKVDKEAGKGLSSSDYTAAEKAKLAGIDAEVAAAVSPKRGKLDLAVYQDAVGWAMADGAGNAYGMFVPLSGSATRWILAEDGQSGAQWGLQYSAAAGTWSLAGEAVSALRVSAPADAATLLFVHSISGVTYTLARVSPIPMQDTLAKLSDIPAAVTIDAALSSTSTNPVQNKAVKAALDGKRGVLDLVVYEDGFTLFTILRDGVDVTSQVEQPVYFDGGGGQPYWDLEGCVLPDETILDGGYDFDSSENALTLGNIITQIEDGQGEPHAHTYTLSRSSAVVPTSDALARASQLAGKQDKYPFVAATVANGALTLQDAKVQTWTPSAGASVTVGAAAYVTGAPARDMVLVIDCSSLTEGDEPTVTWPTAFHPRTDAGTDFACAAEVRNVYYISEYAPGEFVVGGWQETEGGNS